jgi:hypothetical protein
LSGWHRREPHQKDQVEGRSVFQSPDGSAIARPAVPCLRQGGLERECHPLSAAVRFRPARDELSQPHDEGHVGGVQDDAANTLVLPQRRDAPSQKSASVMILSRPTSVCRFQQRQKRSSKAALPTASGMADDCHRVRLPGARNARAAAGVTQLNARSLRR